MKTLRRNNRKTATASLIILLATMLFAALSQSIMVANAQTVATVIILPSIGGTTVPAAGTYTYNETENFGIEAIPDSGYTFQYWSVSGDYTPGHTTGSIVVFLDEDGNPYQGIQRPNPNSAIDSLTFTNNPANISHGYGYTYIYQAVFAPTVTPTPTPPVTSNDTAIVIMEPAVGGTTDPPAGTHVYANGTSFVFTATPDPGYTFQYWVVNGNFTPGHTTGSVSIIYDDNGNPILEIPRPNPNVTIDSFTFTNNPANVSHGYGYTFSYTAVFAPIAASPSPSPTASPTASPTVTPTPTSTPTPIPSPSSAPADNTTLWIVVIVVVVIIIIAAIAAVVMRRKK